jgi:hypothetical protein
MAAISYAFVGREETLNDAPAGLAVQYENPYLRFAAEEFRARTHRKWLISGSAETWLDTRLTTSAFDTFRTGRSLSAHSLMGYWPVGWETVALVTRKDES